MNLRKQIIAKIGKSKQAAGLEVVLFNNGTRKYNVCLLQRKGTQIEKVSESSSDNDYSIIRKDINANIPVSIVVTGHGIITKKVAIEGIKQNEVIHKVLPNANEKDFYLQNIEVDNTHAYVSLVRKDLIDEILQELTDLKFEIIGCSFGPFCINSILPIIGSGLKDDDTITIGAYSIGIKEGKIDSIQVVVETSDKAVFKIGDEEIESKYLLSYSTALAYFTENSIGQPAIPYIENSSSSYIEKRVFSALSKGVLAVFLTLLLINYFLFNHFFFKQSALEATLDNQKSLIQKYDTLKSVLEEKEDFLKKIGFLGEPKTSFYADQLAKDVPPFITLNEMRINPLKKIKNVDEAGIAFSSGVIDLAGVCKDIIQFNDWIKLLKELGWVKELKVLNYNHDKEGDINRFSVEIYIK